MKKKILKFKKFISVFVCVIIAFSCFSICSFAEGVSRYITSSDGTIIQIGHAWYLNNYTGEYYEATVTPDGDNKQVKVNLDGNYNNNTRMCVMQFTIPSDYDPQNIGQFFVHITSAGATNVNSTWALPKLNTERTNNNSFYEGYFEGVNDQYISFRGTLPQTFYVVTWFEYPYDVGYLRTLYVDISWIPLTEYDSQREQQTDEEIAYQNDLAAENFETLFENYNSLGATDLIRNNVVGTALNSATTIFENLLGGYIPIQMLNFIYTFLAVGLITFIYAIYKEMRK